MTSNSKRYTIHTDDNVTRYNPTGRVGRETYTLLQAQRKIKALRNQDRNRRNPRIIKYHIRAAR